MIDAPDAGARALLQDGTLDPDALDFPLHSTQIGCALLFVCVLCLWAYAEVLGLVFRRPEPVTDPSLPSTTAVKQGGGASIDWAIVTHYLKVFSLHREAVLASRETLRAMAEFGGIMTYWVLCDRTKVFGEAGTKVYSRDIFWFVYGVLVFVAAMSSLAKNKHGNAYLNRELTEEWKGWMQVLFLLYHYFNATELYNSIRLFIAAYVWMTGFGNFSYYYVRKDFSLVRFFQMLWRLNFLVLFTCLVLGNSYMLYYICPMHTLFTLFVYATLGIYNRWNENNTFLLTKIGICTLAVAVMWEVPGVFDLIWAPFTPLVQYSDPRHPELPPLHEWFFRSGLDRYVWIFGMLVAFTHPNVDRMLSKIDEMPVFGAWATRSAIVAICIGVLIPYYNNIYVLDKYSYNKLHPFTSWIPITIYILLRNIHPMLRNYSLTLFQWLGRITLETYIGQFHMWLLCRVENGQPKYLLEVRTHSSQGAAICHAVCPSHS